MPLIIKILLHYSIYLLFLPQLTNFGDIKKGRPHQRWREVLQMQTLLLIKMVACYKGTKYADAGVGGLKLLKFRVCHSWIDCLFEIYQLEATVQPICLIPISYSPVSQFLQTGSDRFCSSCKKMFPNGSSLQRHLNSVHSGPGKPHTCPYCTTSFTKQSSIQRHILAVHRRLKPYICTSCGKSFADPSSCRRHMKRPCCGEFNSTGNIH